MNVDFCKRCGYPLETEVGSTLKGWLRCENCKTSYNTPETRDKKEEWKKKPN